MALIALVIVAIAENGRIPVDNPATHLELTMVHEAMVLEYSGRHLALIELASWLKLLLYVSLISVRLRALGARASRTRASPRMRSASLAYLGKLAVAGVVARPVRDDHRQDARLSRARFRRSGAHARLPRRAAALCFGEPLMKGLAFDVAHLLAGGLVLVSFMLLYQNRLYSLLNVFALQAVVLSLSVAWQAYVQGAPHLYVTAAIALVFKAMVIPIALHRIIARLGIHREVEIVGSIGPTMIAGMALVALSMVVMLRVTADADPLGREDLAFALSVVMLGLLMMVTRRNAVSQVVGFMSLGERPDPRGHRRQGDAAGG